MASGFPFPSVPWYTTNEAKFVGNVGLGPLAIAAAPNCSLKCNCKPGFEAFTEISKCAASRYWKSDDSSGAEVRRCCDPSSSSAAGYHLAGDLAKCSNNDSGTLLGSALKAISSTGPSIRCEEQRPCLQDDHITATCRQNAPISVVQSLNSGITRPRSGRASKTRNPTQKVSLGYKPYEPYSMDDGSYPKVSNKRFQDLEAGYRRSTNGEPEVDIYSNGLAAFSDSMNESYLQEDYKSGRGNHDNNEIKENGKVSKRKAGEMERKALAVEVQSGNVDQKSRIVRISRLTGGKDRHSKVLTAKGIRDRRVRLSVPTAIQFYDLQDRLGFEQPSKAVDWLIHNARSSIDKLPVLDAEMAASTSAGNVTQLISSNSSPVEHCVSSPTHSAIADAVSAFRFGMGSLESERTSSQKAMNENPRSNIVTLKDLELVRTTSSISDGTIERSVEHYTSNSSLTKPSSSRVQAIWKATERTKKKSTLAKISGRFASDIRQLKSMQPSLTNPFHGVLPYTRVPLESQHIKDDNPCEIHSQIMMSGTSSVQPLCDSNMPSYTGIVFTNQDSHPFQNMATLGSSAIHNCFPPVPSTSDSIYPIIGSYEMADSAIPFSDTLESRHLGGNAAHTQANLFYSNIHMNIMKSVDEQQQQQHIYKNFVSTILPTYSNDINFSTSSFSRRVPFQSNSSAFITNMPNLEDSEGCGLW